ncbi:hypothetical protein CY35_10G026300 [Sphagnum magellanicum]|nr:hypothetical protein CY35_10G026300 [Sphagnum magellanicum]
MECSGCWTDPRYRRSSCVRALRTALRNWADGVDQMKSKYVALSTAVESCARLEQTLDHNLNPDAFQSSQNQIASLLAAAESILAVEEMYSFKAERNRAAVEASILLFGPKGVIKAPAVCIGCELPSQRRTAATNVSSEAPLGTSRPVSDGCWQPRWPGDAGDPFEPYTQLVEQYLHSGISYHARALSHLSATFGAVRRASRMARDVSYIYTLAAATGLSVKEYQRLLEMFNKIDQEQVGTISKQQLMAAMKRDKDIAAFMQLSRAKGKDGRRESFDGVFNRIDTEGQGAVTWEAFAHFFSCERSLTTDSIMNPMCVQPMRHQPVCIQAAMCMQPMHQPPSHCKITF